MSRSKEFLQNIVGTEKLEDEVERQLGVEGAGQTGQPPVEPVVQQTEVEKPTDDSNPDSVEQPTDKEEEVNEDFGFYTIDSTEEEQQLTDNQEEEIRKEIAKSKVNVNVEDYINENSSKLEKYFKYKNLDVDSLQPEQIVAEGLRSKYPTWTEADIQDELRSKYGIGLKEIQITDDMSVEEEEEAKRHNKRVADKLREGERHLKADAFSFKKDLVDLKNSIELPEFETEVEVEYEASGSSIEQHQEQVNKWYEETWRPSYKETLTKVQGVRKKVKVNIDEGVDETLELSYKFTDEQKKVLDEYLHSYIPNPSDDKYLQEDGSINFDALVQEKAVSLFTNEIISSMVKEGIDKVKGDFVKNRLVNYDDGNQLARVASNSKNFTQEEFFENRAKALGRQKRNTGFGY